MPQLKWNILAQNLQPEDLLSSNYYSRKDPIEMQKPPNPPTDLTEEQVKKESSYNLQWKHSREDSKIVNNPTFIGIPPIPSLSLVQEQPMHLLLSHLVKEPDYSMFYRRLSHKAYLILDNSAHELTEGQGIEKLLLQAGDLGAREIVIPDHLFDLKKTLSLAYESVEWLSNNLKDPMSLPNLMMVPQGQTIKEWGTCLLGLVDLYQRRLVPLLSGQSQTFNLCIGISKDYDEFPGGDYGLLPGGFMEMFQNYIVPLQQEYPNLVFHMLGWPRNLLTPGLILNKFPEVKVRSIDTAKAFVFAQNHIKIQTPRDTYPGRSPHYFQTGLTVDEVLYYTHNTNVLMEYLFQPEGVTV